jgi:hypothetical protein
MRTILNTIVDKAIARINPTTSGVLKEFEKTVSKLHAVSRFQKLKAKAHSDTAAKLQAQVALQVSKTNGALGEAELAEAAANRINKLLVG